MPRTAEEAARVLARSEHMTRHLPPARGMPWRGVPLEMFTKDALERIAASLLVEVQRLEHEKSRLRREPWRRF